MAFVLKQMNIPLLLRSKCAFSPLLMSCKPESHEKESAAALLRVGGKLPLVGTIRRSIKN